MKNRTNHIKDSWNKNAEEWIRAIDSHKISSRQFTNKAIEKLLRDMPEQKILDVGCGEGWLTRSLNEMGKKAVGIDTTEVLLNNARSKGSEAYYNISFEDICAGVSIPDSPYHAAVFNFCIYQKDDLDLLLINTQKSLTENGKIIIQTLHPFFLIESNLPYKSQIMEDAWKGLSGNFIDGHQWYARTFADWMQVISNSGLKLLELMETLNDEGKPVSLILKIG